MNIGKSEDPHYRRDIIQRFGVAEAKKHFEADDLIEVLLERDTPPEEIQCKLEGKSIDESLSILKALLAE